MIADYEGKQVKVTYKDGENVRAFYGCIRDANEFIELQFDDGRKMLVNKSVVLKVAEK